MSLTAKQSRFVEEYLIDKNATQAAIRAGYSEKTAYSIGQENLKKLEIAAAVQKGLERLAESAEVTAERVVAELAKIAFVDMRKLFGAGGQLIDISELDDDTAAAISSVEVVRRAGGEREDTSEHIHKIKVWDKRAALVDLGKHLSMFPTRVEHTGPDGGPLTVELVQFKRDDTE